jgi:hypothetical protein
VFDFPGYKIYANQNYTPSRMPSSRAKTTTNVDKDAVKQECKISTTIKEKQYGHSSKN